jgi:NADH-quinone oxidoreductase subunit J
MQFSIPHITVQDVIHFITIQRIMFAALGALTLGSALLVVTLKNIFHSLLFMALAFLGVAGIYLLLNADFIAAVQVLVYIGAITVLMMFALMLTQKLMSGKITQTMEQWILAAPISLGILVILFRILVLNNWSAADHIALTTPSMPTTPIIGNALLTKFVLPFELASVVLLVAMVGAIVLAKEDKSDGSS